jgi:LysR family glycine cleavage system transcriptional activator
MNRARHLRLSLDLLRGFGAAARHLSFTRAAQELCVTQSAISRGIKTLEDQLGKPLFRRVNRGLQLTPAGEELYRVTDETLAQLDAAVDRIAGCEETLAVTTTPALASLWLAPRLPRFNLLHPGIDVRVVVNNDKIDLQRAQLDIAIRGSLSGADVPDGEPLFECKTFPVCSPTLAREKSCPIKTFGDLANHVRLDFESVRDGRRMSEWDFWFDATNTRRVKPASTVSFPQYDQVVAAAMEGSGVALGVWPYLARHLREGALYAPFGREGVAQRGNFFVVRRPAAATRGAVREFVSWLQSEVRHDGELTLAPARTSGRSAGPPRRAPDGRARMRRT